MSKKLTVELLSFISLFLLFTSSGCMKQAIPIHYYTLGSSAQPAPSPTPSLPPILVGPVHIASFLDQGQIITQNSVYSVNIEEQHRWAGNLQEMLSNTTITNLSSALGRDSISNFSEIHEPGSLQVTIDFLHFERDLNGNGLVMARWKILSEDGTILLHSGTSTYHTTPKEDGFEPLAKALSLGLAQLSEEIAETIRMLTSR